MAMTRPRTSKALYLGLPILFITLVGAGLLAWKAFGPSSASYPRKVMKHAEELQDRILSFDSKITVPWISVRPATKWTKTAPASLI